jgi:hypothetical protein
VWCASRCGAASAAFVGARCVATSSPLGTATSRRASCAHAQRTATAIPCLCRSRRRRRRHRLWWWRGQGQGQGQEGQGLSWRLCPALLHPGTSVAAVAAAALSS